MLSSKCRFCNIADASSVQINGYRADDPSGRSESSAGTASLIGRFGGCWWLYPGGGQTRSQIDVKAMSRAIAHINQLLPLQVGLFKWFGSSYFCKNQQAIPRSQGLVAVADD